MRLGANMRAAGSPAFVPFDPATLAGLVWDLDPDGIAGADGTAVASVPTTTGPATSQGTGANQPTKKTSIFGSHAAIRFASDKYLTTAAFTQAQPFTVMFALKNLTLPVANGRILAGGSVSFFLSSNIFNAFAGSGTAPGTGADVVTGGGGHLCVAVVNGASSKVYVDTGATRTTNNPGASGMSATVMRLGDTAASSAYLAGDLGRMLMYSGAKTAAEINSVAQPLASYLGLSTPTFT